jgi:hypothetical protein
MSDILRSLREANMRSADRLRSTKRPSADELNIAVQAVLALAKDRYMSAALKEVVLQRDKFLTEFDRDDAYELICAEMRHRLEMGIHRRQHIRSLTTLGSLAVPPAAAEFLLELAAGSQKEADGLIGDLNERFCRECKELGHRRAKVRYWARTIRSLRPLVVRTVVRAVKLGAVIALVRRYF